MQEKNEKPSQRKLRKAKEKGNVAKSSELASACILLAGVLLLWSFSTFFEQRFQNLFVDSYHLRATSDPLLCLKNAFTPLAYLTLALMLCIFIVAFFSHFFQTGWIWSWKKNSKKEGFRWIYFPLKLGLLAGISYLMLSKKNVPDQLFFDSSTKIISFILRKIFLLLSALSLGLLFLGICDFVYQKWKHYKKMHMTPQEVKEEKKETEGDHPTKRKRN